MTTTSRLIPTLKTHHHELLTHTAPPFSPLSPLPVLHVPLPSKAHFLLKFHPQPHSSFTSIFVPILTSPQPHSDSAFHHLPGTLSAFNYFLWMNGRGYNSEKLGSRPWWTQIHCMSAQWLSCVRFFVTLRTVSLARLLCSWDFLGKNIGVGCHALLQEIFLTQGSKLRLLCLLHWQADSSSLSHLRSPLKFTSKQLTIIKEINTHTHTLIFICSSKCCEETYAANGKWEDNVVDELLWRPLEETAKQTTEWGNMCSQGPGGWQGVNLKGVGGGG